MKSCTKCGSIDASAFNAGSGSYCRPCKSEHKRRSRAAKKRTSEHNYGVAEVPEGFRIKGITQLLDSAGKIKSQHVKTELEPVAKEDKSALLLEALRGMCEPYRGTVPATAAPKESDEDLIVVVPIGDMHVGLQCHADEVGEDYDRDMAESDLVAAVDGLIESGPAAVEMLLIDVGDYLHSDNSRSQTTKGTPLDTSGSRFTTLLIALRMFRRCIDMGLRKYQRVTVISSSGNHNSESAVWLRLCLALVYEAEPRVIIRTEPSKFHWHRFGRCLFGVTHGDTCKVADLPMIMACDRKEDWAETEHRHWYTGHVHHSTVKELHGCTVETFRTLAQGDKWHNWEGYRSERDLRLDVWHREYGQIQRLIYGIRRTRARVAA